MKDSPIPGLASLALLAAAVLLILTCSSCTITLAPDGSKSATVDAEQFYRAIQILAEK